MVIRKLLLTITLILMSFSLWASLAASVDKTIFTEDEQITLTLVTDSFQLMSSPDFSILENDFDVLGSQRSSTIRIINGQNQSTNKWIITLAPKSTGKLTIPAIQMGSDKSQPINITINKAKAASSASANKDVFMEVTVDKKKVYVQAQLIYTLRLYYGPDIVDGDLTEPELNDALVELLGEQKSYSKTVEGRRYRVFERSYAIFPQKSGTLKIPQQIFTGKVEQVLNRRGFFSSSTWKTIRIRSEAKSIEVLSPPAKYKDSTWLPAAKLTAKAYWSEASPTFKVGEPVTRVFEIKAEGLSATQLPPINEQNLADFKIYPDNPATSIKENEKGLVGVRKETAAYVPTKPGDLTLPEHKITWWDTTANKVRTTVIPAETITVISEIATESATPIGTTATTDAKSGTDQTATIDPNIRLWQLLTGFFVFTTIIFALLWLAKRPKQIAETKIKQPSNTALEAEAFKALTKAIKNNAASETHSQILAWLKIIGKNNVDMQQLIALAKKHQKDHLLLELEFVLYGKGGETKNWNGAGLGDLLKLLRKELQDKAANKQEALPELYPA